MSVLSLAGGLLLAGAGVFLLRRYDVQEGTGFQGVLPDRTGALIALGYVLLVVGLAAALISGAVLIYV